MTPRIRVLTVASVLSWMLFGQAAFVYGTGAIATHYDISLRPDYDKNSILCRVNVVIGNQADSPLGSVMFDLLAWGDICGLRVKDLSISRIIDGKPAEQQSSRTQEKHGAITSVRLLPEMKPGETAQLLFEYTIEASRPGKRDDNYRPFATLPSGDKEVCLLGDYAWIPKIMDSSLEDRIKQYKANLYPKEAKPTWQVSITVPERYDSVALNGRHVGTSKDNGLAISVWKSRSPGFPEVMIGSFSVVSKGVHGNKVTFYLPQGGYRDGDIDFYASLLADTRDFYTHLYGALEGDSINVGISSANQGGHGTYLGLVLDKEQLRTHFAHTACHELAHSWWGNSVTSYGRGTKFLRESLAEFSCWHMQRTRGGQDQFAETMAMLFWLDEHRSPLCFQDRDAEDAAYKKGPLILDILRSEMGDEVFFKVLKEFAGLFGGKTATLSDFIGVCGTVSGKEWKTFFDEWLFRDGCPVYKVLSVISAPAGEQWTTSVRIQNAGEQCISCPIDLQMAEGSQRHTVRVPSGNTVSFEYKTPQAVKSVVIDPEHRTYQGGDEERRVKMLGVGKTRSIWIQYWRGVAYAEIGEYESAISEIERAIKANSVRHPAYMYSRGICLWRHGDKDKAVPDLAEFIDWILTQHDPRMFGALAYAGIVSKDPKRREAELIRILQGITGQEFRTLSEWRGWWSKKKSSLTINQMPAYLHASGIREESASK